MAKKFSMSPTMVGAYSVVLWGSALPIIKLVEERIGLLAFMGIAYAVMAGFGLIHQVVSGKRIPRAAFGRGAFYARWIFFVLHEGLLTAGVAMVERRHMPFVILINYLWPTAIILCSVMLQVVTVRRWWALLLGTMVVLLSLAAEVIGPSALTGELFARREDCVAYALVLVGAVSWGMYSALSRRDGDATGGAEVLPLFQATLGLALPASLLPASLLPGMGAWGRLSPALMLLFGAYCVLMYFSYATWDFGMRRGNVVVLSLLADLIPWLSLVTTDLMLHVAIGGRTVISAVALVVGAMITRYGTAGMQPVPAAYEEPVP